MHCTVVMPCYNTQDYIQEAIQSVLKQTYTDFDILVVDDGSSDRTTSVVESLMPGHDISLIRLSDHRGAARTTRIGLEQARGPIVTIVDSDDRITAESLQTVMPYFDDPELGYLWTRFICSNGRMGWARNTPDNTHMFDALTHSWWNGAHQRFVSLDWYRKSCGIRDDIPSASDLQLALLVSSTRCRCLHVPVTTYWYRIGRKGAISRNSHTQRTCAQQLIAWARKGFK